MISTAKRRRRGTALHYAEMLLKREKANKILLDEASVSYSSDYSPDVVHRDYMVVECEEWLGG